MPPAFILTLREGLHAFLIVAVTLAYFNKTGRSNLVRAIQLGIWISVVSSIAAATAFQQATNQALWEGILAMTAAALGGYLAVHVWRAARCPFKSPHHLDRTAVRGQPLACLGMFLFTLLMITREGMEIVIVMKTLIFQIKSVQAIAFGIAGTLLAATLAWAWSRYGTRLETALLLEVTLLFLLLFVAQTSTYGFHELTEANLLPASEALHWATEPYGPDGRYGHHFTYLLGIIPLTWLAITTFRSSPSSRRIGDASNSSNRSTS